jgi:hypothetical protein
MAEILTKTCNNLEKVLIFFRDLEITRHVINTGLYVIEKGSARGIYLEACYYQSDVLVLTIFLLYLDFFVDWNFFFDSSFSSSVLVLGCISAAGISVELSIF